MKLTTEELIALMESREDSVTEVAQLRERVLKLEHKLNELYDMLTDLRVKQVMAKAEEVITKVASEYKNNENPLIIVKPSA